MQLDLLHFSTITCHIQNILLTLALMSSIQSLDRKGTKIPLDVPFGLMNYCNEFLEIPANVAEIYFPGSSLNSRVQASRHQSLCRFHYWQVVRGGHIQPANTESTMMLNSDRN